MQRLVLTTPTAERHVQEWTFQDGAASHTMHAEYTRKQ
jgi:hypothetical protein